MGNAFCQCCESHNTNRLSEISLQAYYTSQEKKTVNSAVCSDSKPNIAFEKQEDFTQSTQVHSSQLTDKHLLLKVINSGNLEKGRVLNISSAGLEGSKRNANDGSTYFGCKKKQNGKVVNDFIIPVKEKELGDQHRGRHFVIYYHHDKHQFYIRDLAIGFGAFMRVDSPLVRDMQPLKDNYLINIGESFLVVNLSSTEDASSTQLRLKVFGAPYRGQVL